jgi:crotonobetainyl-CoA:carnitine CoA-transferase CaiB-like acyl-CoA transferase
LQGIRVVDLCVIFAGPFATWLLASMGAEVIRVDSIQHWPDQGRAFALWPTPEMLQGLGGTTLPGRKPGEKPWNRNAIFTRVAWNKLSCCIDLTSPQGKEVFKKLIAVSDVFIENNGADVMEHLELGHDVLMKVNPGLICINMPSYGRTGPYKSYVGWGDNAEALAGHNWLRGYPDENHPLHNTPVFHMDSSGGVLAAFAAIMALRHRQRTGRGQWIDFAQIESVFPQLAEAYMDYAWNGRNQRTIGNHHPSAFQGCYRCRGQYRWVNITINSDEEWQHFCSAIGNPPWTEDERFSDVLSRYKNHDELDRLIEEWTSQHDNFEVFYIMQRHGVPAGPVEDHRDAYMDPQLNARDFFQVISQADIGTYRYPGFLWKMSETPCSYRLPPCRLGEHNDYVFREVIGLSEEEITRLQEEKIIGGERYLWA